MNIKQIFTAILVNCGIYCLLTFPHILYFVSNGELGFKFPITALIPISVVSAFSHLIYQKTK